jgi:hypothetical protein
VHAHEEVGNRFFEFLVDGLEGNADVVIIEEMQCLFLQTLFLLALVQTLLQTTLAAKLPKQVLLRPDRIHQVTLVFVSLADPQMGAILPPRIRQVAEQ